MSALADRLHRLQKTLAAGPPPGMAALMPVVRLVRAELVGRENDGNLADVLTISFCAESLHEGDRQGAQDRARSPRLDKPLTMVTAAARIFMAEALALGMTPAGARSTLVAAATLATLAPLPDALAPAPPTPSAGGEAP